MGPDYSVFVSEFFTVKLTIRTKTIRIDPMKNGQSLPNKANTYPLPAGPKARASVEAERPIPKMVPCSAAVTCKES